MAARFDFELASQLSNPPPHPSHSDSETGPLPPACSLQDSRGHAFACVLDFERDAPAVQAQAYLRRGTL